MLKISIQAACFIAIMGLSGCDKFSEIASGHNIEVSSLPLAQQTISSMVPLFDGKRNKVIMDKVCAYVSGKETLDEFKSFFSTKGVNVGELAKLDSGFRTIATADKSELTSACAAFMVSTFFTEQNLLDGSDPKATEVQINERLKRLTPISLETIKILSEISASHQGEVFASHEAYTEKLKADFKRKAKNYIDKTLNHDFILSDYNDSGSENGFSYTFSSGLVRLKLYDEVWFGDGKLMGKRYFIYLKSALGSENY